MDKMHVVTVDDNPTVLRAISAMLEMVGFRVTAFTKPEKALGFCLAQNDVDILVSDFCMPVMDGLDLFSALRKEDHDLPIIILTGSANTPRLEQASRLGAKVLTKPIGVWELKSHIDSHSKRLFANIPATEAGLRHYAI